MQKNKQKKTKNMTPKTKKLLLLLVLFHFSSSLIFGQRQMENLDRGIIAVKENGHFYIGWRILGTDPDDLAFNLYRKSGNEKPVRVNEKRITGATNFIDTNAKSEESNTWFVKTVLNGKENK